MDRSAEHSPDNRLPGDRLCIKNQIKRGGGGGRLLGFYRAGVQRRPRRPLTGARTDASSLVTTR